MARSGSLPAHPLGNGKRRQWRFKLSELDKHMQGGIETNHPPVAPMRGKLNGATASKRASQKGETQERTSVEFLWRETGADGERHQRTLVIGSVREFRTERDALCQIQTLRTNINHDSFPVSALLTFSGMADHYRETELVNGTKTRLRRSTACIYRAGLNRAGDASIWTTSNLSGSRRGCDHSPWPMAARQKSETSCRQYSATAKGMH